MARDEATRTHLENLVLTANSDHGDASGDVIFQINTLNDDVNHATAVFKLLNTGAQQAISTLSSATPATTRALYGQLIMSGTAMDNTGNPSFAGTRGEVKITGTVVSTNSLYFYGAQGKLIITGTMNDASAWCAGVFAQLDLSSITLTAGQIAGLWVDMGAAASASAKSGQANVNCIRVTNSIASFLPHAVLSVEANASYFADLSAADGSGSGWYDALTTASAACSGHIKIKLAGTDAYLRVYGGSN